jgi:hypothetical protein
VDRIEEKLASGSGWFPRIGWECPGMLDKDALHEGIDIPLLQEHLDAFTRANVMEDD